MITEQCKTFLRLLDDYLDGTLEPERRNDIEQHVAQCAHCRHELEAHQRIIASLKNLEKKSAPQTVHAEIMARLEGRTARIAWGARIQSLFSPRKLRVALEVAAVFIIVFVGWQIFNSSSLQLTLREKKTITHDDELRAQRTLQMRGTSLSSSMPATVEESATKLGIEVREAVEEEAAAGIKTVKPLEELEVKKEMQEILAGQLATQVEGVDVVPSTVPAEGVAGGQIVIKKEIEDDLVEFAPAPSRENRARMGDVVREPQVKAPPPKDLPMSEPEHVLIGKEDLRAAQLYSSSPSMVQERMFSEGIDKLEEQRLDIKAKPEAKAADYIDFSSPDAIQTAPYSPTEGTVSRGQIVRKSGISVNGTTPLPPGSPVADKLVADGDTLKDQNLNMAFLGRAEQKGLFEKASMESASVVISAAPGKPRRVFGYYVSPGDLSNQSKVVMRILRQNRGNVLSVQEEKEEITIKSQLPASAYRKVVDQLENKGFTIKREVPPKLLDRAREEETERPKAANRFYSKFEFREFAGESRQLIPKSVPVPESSRQVPKERQRGTQVPPPQAVISEHSISITITIQGTSPSPEATP